MQKALIKIKQLEGQEEWTRQRELAQEEANRARSDAAKQQPRENDKFSSGLVSTDTAPARDERARYEVARQANISNATAARASALWNSRPDLAEEVIAGNLRPTEAERQRKRDEYAERQPELPKDKYRVIYADPPWSYGNTQPDYHGVQDDHYPIMKLSEICAMPIRELVEDDAVLFLWVTSPILEESFQVIKAWGFEYKSSFIWDKIKHNMGHYNSVRHEILLICTRGSCTPDNRKLFDSVYQEERTEHSRKPEYFRDVIDTIYPHGKRIELFARSKHGNWDNYGNESLS
jgi:N6-adenosine-specific RNA methylase IME4